MIKVQNTICSVLVKMLIALASKNNSYLFQVFVCWWLVEYSLPSFLCARCASDHRPRHVQHTNSAKCMKMSRHIRVVQSSWKLDYLYTALLNGLILLIAWFNNLIHRPSAAISSALGFKYKSLMSAIYKKRMKVLSVSALHQCSGDNLCSMLHYVEADNQGDSLVIPLTLVYTSQEVIKNMNFHIDHTVWMSQKRWQGQFFFFFAILFASQFISF